MFPKDPIMQKLSEKYPPLDFTNRPDNLMQALIRAIIGQQLSVKAAQTISGMLVKSRGGYFSDNFA